jgi:predicted nicotinamide N-methyase
VPHPRNRLSIADCQVVDGAPAVLLGSGAIRANIHDNHFQSVPGKPAIQIDKGADLLVITNNVLSSKEPIKDDSDKTARKNISGNVVEE